MTPANADITADRTNSATLTRSTLTPRARAALGVAAGRLDPVAVLRLRQHDSRARSAARDEPEQRGVDAEPHRCRSRRPAPWRAIGRSALQVRCGKPSVTNSAVPRTTSSMPSVTRNEGIFSRVTNKPLTSPISAATTRQMTKATLERRRAAVEQRPHQHRREAEQRADREIELARGHQQRHGERDEAELDREGQRVADVERRTGNCD